MAESTRSIGFEHVGISVADLAAMSGWYADALGLAAEGEFEIGAIGVRGRILGRDGFKVELIEMEASGPDPIAPRDPGSALARQGIAHICLRVDDIDVHYADLVERGASAMISPRLSPLAGWKFAYVGDPEGNLIELMEAV